MRLAQGGLTAVPVHEVCPDLNLDRRNRRVLYALQEPENRLSAEMLFWHIDRREVKNLRDRDVVEADDCNILRDAEPFLPEGLDGTGGN